LLPEDPRTLTINRRFWASFLLTIQLFVALAGAAFVAWLAFTLVFQGLDKVGFGLLTVATSLNDWLTAALPT
jgi:hypothetical protein